METVLKYGFNPASQARPHIPGLNDEVVRIAGDLRFGPVHRTIPPQEAMLKSSEIEFTCVTADTFA
ncbi:MAG: hypothetical protein ACKO2L_19680 [Planctomycetaceae bacterium]